MGTTRVKNENRIKEGLYIVDRIRFWIKQERCQEVSLQKECVECGMQVRRECLMEERDSRNGGVFIGVGPKRVWCGDAADAITTGSRRRQELVCDSKRNWAVMRPTT